MKNILAIIFLSAITTVNAQVVLGGSTGTASDKTSVLLDFAPGLNKGIILPYVRVLPTASTANQGTILLDAVTASSARMKFSNGTSWVDLSGQDGNVASALLDQPTTTTAPELASSKTIITDGLNVVDPATVPEGILVLQSTTKAMVLPQVNEVSDIPSPSPGMMVYVNKTGAKRLAVYNGNKWSFWKP